jgi:hypothetical protein
LALSGVKREHLWLMLILDLRIGQLVLPVLGLVHGILSTSTTLIKYEFIKDRYKGKGGCVMQSLFFRLLFGRYSFLQ